MEVLWAFMLFAFFLSLLIIGGDWLVDGSVALARKFGLSELFIGLTVVAFGTSLPELFVSMKAAFAGAPGISIGNVVGSNIYNVLLILGIATTLMPFSFNKGLAYHEGIFHLILSGAIAGIMLLSGVLDERVGLLLVPMILLFVLVLYLKAQIPNSSVALEIEDKPEAEVDIWTVSYKILGGALGLYFGAEGLIPQAVKIAGWIGVPESVIAISMIAFGTSLPELSATIAAVREKKGDLILGNVVGSNIFNIASVLGITSLIHPIKVEIPAVDVAVMLLVALALQPFLHRGRFGRWSFGIPAFVLGIAYTIFLYVR